MHSDKKLQSWTKILRKIDVYRVKFQDKALNSLRSKRFCAV